MAIIATIIRTADIAVSFVLGVSFVNYKRTSIPTIPLSIPCP